MSELNIVFKLNGCFNIKILSEKKSKCNIEKSNLKKWFEDTVLHIMNTAIPTIVFP